MDAIKDAVYGNAKSVVNFYRTVTRGNLVLVAGSSQTFQVSLKGARDEDDVDMQVERTASTKPSSFDLTIYILPRNFNRGAMLGMRPAGLGTMDGRTSFFLQADEATIAHEAGHNLGLAHSGVMSGSDLNDYGDPSSIMSGSYFGLKWAGLCAFSHYWLNRDPAAVLDVTRSGIYKIKSLSSNSDPSSARIFVGGVKPVTADSFPAIKTQVVVRRGAPLPPQVDMNAGVFWVEWHEPINQDQDINDIITLNGVRGPLFRTLLIKTITGPRDEYYNRVSVLRFRLQVGESAVLDNGVRVTHIDVGTMAVEYPGSPVDFTTASTTAITTTTTTGATQTTAPGTKTYKCTRMASSAREKPEFASKPWSVAAGTKFLFMGVPVPQYAQVKDCRNGATVYVPFVHLADCGPNLAKLPCAA